MPPLPALADPDRNTPGPGATASGFESGRRHPPIPTTVRGFHAAKARPPPGARSGPDRESRRGRWTTRARPKARAEREGEWRPVDCPTRGSDEGFAGADKAHGLRRCQRFGGSRVGPGWFAWAGFWGFFARRNGRPPRPGVGPARHESTRNPRRNCRVPAGGEPGPPEKGPGETESGKVRGSWGKSNRGELPASNPEWT